MARSHCCDQHLARLLDRENCEPVAFLLSQLSTQLIITIDDPGESSPDGSRIFTELSDAVEGKKTGTCKEQAHLSWSTLATEDVSDRLLRRMILVGVDCAIHHDEGEWSLERCELHQRTLSREDQPRTA